MFDVLRARGFQVETTGHARAILEGDFSDALRQLESALLGATIPVEEIIAGGGGEAKGTQRLRRALARQGWRKHKFVVQKIIDGLEKESQSHEIDHVKTFDHAGTIALEIEWNNKDPFYDRDLENFKRLHADGAISVGLIVTRGRSLHEGMRDLVRRFMDERQIQSFDDLEQWHYQPTPKQRQAILKQAERDKDPLTFREAFARNFVSSKFGEATTHWKKLEDRIRRGVGNPCPLVFIGLPDSIVTFHEGMDALAEVEAAENDEERQSTEL